MRISYKGDYALKVILDLAINYQKELTHIEEMAQRQDIPQKFLEQILLDLKKGGFVQSKKGPNGGYSLTRQPQEIKLGDVVRYIDGSLYPVSCVDPAAAQTCQETSSCIFFPIWQEVGDAISQILDNQNFDQLKEQALKQQQKKVLTYSI